MNWVSIYGILALVTGFLFLGQTILGLIGGIGDGLDFDADADTDMDVDGADGAKQMAEAKKVEMQAETENLANLARADVGDATMISYVLKDQWIGMVEAEMKKFEHINLGTVTVVGGSDKAADFMGNIAKVVQGASGLGSENVPGIMGVIGKLMNFDKKNQIQQPTEEPEQPQEETPKESK